MRQPLLALLALALPALSPPAHAAPSDDALQSWRAARDRFEDRAAELRMEALDGARILESARRKEIQQAYDPTLERLAAEEGARRDAAITQLEGFIQRNPAASETPRAMLQLAELYAEDATERWLAESARYEEMLATLGEFATSEELPPPPSRDLSRSAYFYRRVLDGWPQHPLTPAALYGLAFCYLDPLTTQSLEPEAAETATALLEQLLTEHPRSSYSPDAHFLLGEAAFDEYDPDAAARHFQALVDGSTPEHILHDRGLYMLAWTQYKQSKLDEALGTFDRLLALDTDGGSPLRPEAIQYTAIALSERSEGGDALTDADAWFAQTGPRPWAPEVMGQLAETLRMQARYDEAIAVWRALQARWPEAPEALAWQRGIAEALSAQPLPDDDAVRSAMTELVEGYGPQSAWSTLNRLTFEVDGRPLVRDAQATLASEAHVAAQRSGLAADYAAAAVLYERAIALDPVSADAERLRFYLADTLRHSGEPLAAASLLDALIAEGGAQRDAALYVRVVVLHEAIQQKHGGAEAVPEGAAVVGTRPTASGEGRPMRALSALHTRTIDAVDALLAASLEDPEYAAAREANGAALAWLPAQILQAHGYAEEAAPRLRALIEAWPDSVEADYALALLVNGALGDGDYARAVALINELGGGNLTLEPIAAGAAFKLAMRDKEVGRLAEAAAGYLALAERYPGYEGRAAALWNAARCQWELGDGETATATLRRLVDEHPADAITVDAYVQLARWQETLLEPAAAVDTWLELVERYPEVEEAADALRIAGLLSAAQGRHRVAAEVFERYATLYPERDDADAVAWAAAEQLTRVNPLEGADAWARYVQRAGRADPDAAIAGRYHQAQALRAVGRVRQAERVEDALLSAYHTRLKAGETPDPRARRAAGAVAVARLVAQVEAFDDVDYPDDEDALVAMLIKDRPKVWSAIDVEARRIIADYEDAASASAALHLLGSVTLDYAWLLVHAPVPESIRHDPELVAEFERQMQELAAPIFAKGTLRLEQNLEMAQAKGYWTPWTQASLERLREELPDRYPAAAPESRAPYDLPVIPQEGPSGP
ncbi:MAG: tetratricopeptide repeat protein [Alphaproteobacteria bacterium]|nr:tetratricopeptide repeat protein [Alphaproteobacteria bacterium]